MKNDLAIDIDSSVTTIIVQRPLKNCVAQYEEWLKEIVPTAQKCAGHRGVNVIRPHGHDEDYTIILHFDSETNLRGWLDSDVRKNLVEKVRSLLNTQEKIEIKTGLEFWFTPPDSKKIAPAHKQFLITLSAIFPLTIIIPWALSPLFSAVPELSVPIVKPFIIAVTIVALMTFVIMPRYVRLISKWLYR